MPAAEMDILVGRRQHEQGARGQPARGQLQEHPARVHGALGNIGDAVRSRQRTLCPASRRSQPPAIRRAMSRMLLRQAQARSWVQADVTASLGVLFVRNPGWHAVFDMDGPMAEQTRRKLYDMAATERMPIQGFHFPFPALGYIEKDGCELSPRAGCAGTPVP